jgi:hypothetical protein
MIKDLIKLPVRVVEVHDEKSYVIADCDKKFIAEIRNKDIAEALCTLINAQNADVGTLAEYIAEFSDWYMVNRHKFSEPTFKGNIEIAQQYISENPIATIKSADVGKLAEEYAQSRDLQLMAGKHGYSFQQLKDAVLYGSTLSANKWVRVEDRLPSNGIEVLCCQEKSVLPAIYENNQFMRYPNAAKGDKCYMYYYPDVTHWQPLPELPKSINK